MSYFTSEIGPSKGFHPVSRSTIHFPDPNKYQESCALHIHHILPALVFVDTHELAQRNESYAFNHWGSRDLEKPAHALPDEISELLLTIRLPTDHPHNESEDPDEGSGTDLRVEVPMHLRYGSPKSISSTSDEEQTDAYERIRVDWPQAFLSCPSSSNVHVSSKYNIPYISRMIHTARGITKGSRDISLPQHVLSVLPPDNVFVAIHPHSDFSDKFSVLYLPLGNTKDLAFVELLTALTILACCFWLFRVAKKTSSRLNANPAPRPKTS